MHIVKLLYETFKDDSGHTYLVKLNDVEKEI